MAVIRGKIDVTKIDKRKLFRGKNGAMYLDFVLIETPDNQYGDDYMVKEDVSKEDRESGVQGTILGNAKVFGADSAPRGGGAPQKGGRRQPAKQEFADDELPF